MNFLKNLVNTAADQFGAGNLQAATGNISGFGASFNQKPGFDHNGRSHNTLGLSNTRTAFQENAHPRANSTLRMPGPQSSMVANRPAPSPKAQAAPSVDLSGLTAEEQAQIAAVMAKANAMDSDIAPSGPPPTPAPAQPRQQPPSLPPPRYLWSAVRDITPRGISTPDTVRQVPLNQNILVAQREAQNPNLSTPEGMNGMQNRTSSPQETHSLSKTSSKSPSRDAPLPQGSFTTTTSSSPLQAGFVDGSSTFSVPHVNTTSLSPVAPRAALSAEDSSRVEWCPLCKKKELKIVVVHGRTQPLIGQSCAICGLIVCCNCGKVQKDPEQKKGYWICNECGDDQYDNTADTATVAATLDGSPNPHRFSQTQPQVPTAHTDHQLPPEAQPLPPYDQAYEDEQNLADHDEPYSFRPAEQPEDTQFHSQYTEPFGDEEDDDNEEEWMTEQSMLRNDQTSPALGTWPAYPKPGLSSDDQWDQDQEDFHEEEEHYDDTRTPHGPLSDYPSPEYGEQSVHGSTMDSTKNQAAQAQPYHTYHNQYGYLQQEEDMTSDYGSQAAPVASGSSSSGAIDSAIVVSDLPSLSNSTSGDVTVASPNNFGQYQSRNSSVGNNSNNQNWYTSDQDNQSKVSPTKAEEQNGNGNNIRRSGHVQNFRSMAPIPLTAGVQPMVGSPTQVAKQSTQPVQAEPFPTHADSPDSGVSGLHRAYAKFRAETQTQVTETNSPSPNVAPVSNFSTNSPQDNYSVTQKAPSIEQNQMNNLPQYATQSYQQSVPVQPLRNMVNPFPIRYEVAEPQRPLEVSGAGNLATATTTKEAKSVSSLITDFESMRTPMSGCQQTAFPTSSSEQPSNKQRQALSTHPETGHIDYATWNPAAIDPRLTSHSVILAALPSGQVNINPSSYRKDNLASYVESPSTPSQRSQSAPLPAMTNGTAASSTSISSKALDVNTVANSATQIDEEALTLVQRPLSSAEHSQTHSEAGSATSTMNRGKRRLPLLPRPDDTMFLDDSSGTCLTPEEQQRQKQELKRRLSSNFYKFVPASTHTERRLPPLPVSIKAGDNEEVEPEVDHNVTEWNGASELQETAISHNAARHASYKRKKHKHLPAIPANECPKVQLLKQQLFMLAARKADRHASSHSHFQKPYGSLPNRPLSPPYDLSTNLPNAASSTGNDAQPEATKTVGIYHKGQNGYHHRLHKRMLPASGASQSASDPQIFHNILKQYRQLKKEDDLDNIRRYEMGKMEFENERDFRRDFDQRRADFRDRDQGPAEDPKLQSLLFKLQQINRNLYETKELFRSTSRLNITALENQPPSALYHPCDFPPPALPPFHHDGAPPPNYRRPAPPPLQRHWSSASMIQTRNGTINNFNDGPFRPLLFNGPNLPRRASISNMHAPYPNHFQRHQPFFNSDSNLFRNDLPNPNFVLPLSQSSYLEAAASDVQLQNNYDLSMYEPFDDPYFLPTGNTNGPLVDQRVPYIEQQPIPPNSTTSTLSRRLPRSSSRMRNEVANGEELGEPLEDSRVSFSTESPTAIGLPPVKNGQRRTSRAGSATRLSVQRVVDVDGLDKDHVSEAGDDGEDALNSAEQLSRSMSAKRSKKDMLGSTEHVKQKYNFATKRILLTRDPKDRSASGNGLGVRIAGGKLIPNSNALGAFISKIWDNGIMATLDTVKEGDQVLEWNGVPLTNKSYEEVQEILEQGNGEVDMLVRCDFNVRNLELELEQSRNQTKAILAQTERARMLDSADKSALPSRSLFSGKRDGSHKGDDAEEVVYRAPNQLVPPSPAAMQRKKSTSSGHAPVTGDIMLRMTYERCTLTLQVIKARNLKPADKSGFSDPYCKINLVPGRASEYKYRTRHIMQTLNPEWKETFTFQSIDPNEIHHKQIEITVWDWDRLSADDFLGEVIVDLTDPVHLDGTKRWYPLGERRPGTTDDM
ncbi:hypothetical protein RvY_14233 [Ramazzottius varieornatus]|uniref:Protein piccolo n=1 Tax=Ramazzottius varieornatus TaxID=947166 RepID=A0A1D1VXW6_RAMVA|nr:hypothetical protein RvY_14233 [Ramazzottius varieornatus]